MAWLSITTELLKLLNNLFVTPKKQIKKVVTIYDAMHRVLDETPVQRFIIFKAHNGGGVIKPHTPLYVSALYEDYTSPFKSVKDDYQRLEADEATLRILSDLSVTRQTRLRTKDLKKGMIADIYKSEGVVYAEWYFLGHDKKNLYYCSVATSQENEEFQSPHCRTELNVAVNQIRNNIK